MTTWLVKTEPSTYSIEDLKRDKVTVWDGVRHPKAKQFMMQMKKGEKVLIYHSGQKQIVGLGEITANIGQDPNDVRSWLVKIKYIKKFHPPFVTLAQVKSDPEFKKFRLVVEPRLSVMDVPPNFIKKYIPLD